MANQLNPYRGTLSITQIAEGMNCATKNARRLADDANILLSKSRFASAASLATLSIEESGKVVILRRFITAADDKERNGLWKEYRSHKKKNLNWILPDLVLRGARKLDDFRKIFDETSDHPEILDSVKQLGFYTDCLGSAHWSIPDEVVDESLAKSLVKIAEILAPERKITVTELQLWEKHMKPVWKKNDEWMRTALANWYSDMQANGLMPEGENKMARFIQGGLTDNQADQLHDK